MIFGYYKKILYTHRYKFSSDKEQINESQYIVLHPVSSPESRSGLIRGSEPVSGMRDSGLGLITFFFLKKNRTGTRGYGPHLITIQNITYIYRVPFTYTNLNFYITNQTTTPTCSEPLQVCWPSCMRMFTDNFSCTYTE